MPGKLHQLFESARLNLTLRYLVIIMMVSVFFSAAFYQSSTRELQRIINRVELEQRLEAEGIMAPQGPGPKIISVLSLEDLQQLKHQSLVTLLILNAIILVLSGIAGYFLAGQTLRPIQEAMAQQDEFISNASHELRTPLAVLQAEIETSLMSKKLTAATARKLLRSNLEEVSRLQKLSTDLLHLLQSPQLSSSELPSTSSVSEAVTKVVKKLQKKITAKRIKLKIARTKAFVAMSESDLIQVLTTLLDNACKYSLQDSSVEVRVQQQKAWVVISVQDQGIGIASQDLEHVFERFYRADASRSKVDGFGLGLAIAKSVVERAGGQIRVSSREGVGSTFEVVVPAVGI